MIFSSFGSVVMFHEDQKVFVLVKVKFQRVKIFASFDALKRALVFSRKAVLRSRDI
jgi:hypothetical protein